jgi:hypothetical protein
MSLYDRPVRRLIPDMISELAPKVGERFSKEDAIKWFQTRYPKIKPGTISAHLIRFSTNAPSRLHYGVKPEEDLLFQVDGSHFRRFDSANDPTPIHSKFDVERETAESAADDDEEEVSEFAYESDLRDFLAKNLRLIEPGLELYNEEGVTGVEFPAGGRFIDILAVDAKKRLVVIELKVSRGCDRVVGQLLRYMGWIEQNLAEADTDVRGTIAAREISDDLKLACKKLRNVDLFEYELSVELTKIRLSNQ